MGVISKIFKPRRGKASTMISGSKKETVLAAGEFFLEVPDTGAGKGRCKVKVGDGSTAYPSLPYALGDTSNESMTVGSNSSTTVATSLNSVATGKSLATCLGGLKQAISLCSTSITALNDDIKSFQNGVDKIYNKCKSLGSTPISNTPDSICTAIDNIKNSNSYIDSSTNSYPFYPSNYSWRWDNSSNTSSCTITYIFNVNCTISNASGDAAGLNGYHAAGTSFQIVKNSNYGAPSSSKSAVINMSSAIFKNEKSVPFYPSNVLWRWDDSSNTSSCAVTYTFGTHCYISNASGDFSNIKGLHKIGDTFTITKNGSFGAPSSGARGSLSGGNSISWKVVKYAIINDYS